MSDHFNTLVALMARLRAEGGCPWDREQTHDSLKPFLIEEAYEVLEAIESRDAESLCEELGDLLFQVLFHAEIAKEKGLFDIEAVLRTITEKMTRRHPHVFSDNKNHPSPDSQEVLGRWEEMKKKETRNRHRKSALEGVPKTLPSLLRAHQIQSRAARIGFDWPSIGPVFEKVEEELQELQEAVTSEEKERIEWELGDLLFSIVNYARFLEINSEDAMRGTIQRFSHRFQMMEEKAAEKGTRLASLSLDEMQSFWEWSKRKSDGKQCIMPHKEETP